MDTHKISFRQLTSSPLARNSAIVFAGSMAANIGSYAYHLLMGRMLGPSGYGELSSLISLLYILTVPINVMVTVLVKFVSGFKAKGEPGQAKSLLFTVTKILVLVLAIGFPFVYILAPWVTSFLHLSTSTLVILIYLLSVFSFLSVPPMSIISGYQRFVWMSVFATMAIFIKLVLSIPMTVWGVYGVLVASVTASIIVYFLYYFPLQFVLRAKAVPTNLSKRSAFAYAVPTLLALFGLTSLYSTDIILVRHYFGAKDAGLYAALAILGKIVFYASSAITAVMFPTVAERVAVNRNTTKLIRAAVIGVTTISAGITTLYFLFPELIMKLLFGQAYTGAGGLLGSFGIFISLYSIGFIITMACLAMGKTRIWVVPAVCSILQILGITLFHGLVGSVVYVNVVVSFLFMVLAGLFYLRISYEKV